jgi:hypothetical protein
MGWKRDGYGMAWYGMAWNEEGEEEKARGYPSILLEVMFYVIQSIGICTALFYVQKNSARKNDMD